MRRKLIPYCGHVYYHAGSDHGEWVQWADGVTKSLLVAVRTARAMAQKHGGRPLIEWWPRSRGTSPGPDVAEGALYVDEDLRPE
jgi:hypothetical protein